MRIPIVFVGNNSMIELFSDVLRNARWACGMGLYDFQRPAQDDPAWQLLVEHAWDYQWVRHVEPLTPGIAATLYDLTQGVTDFLIKLLVLGQRHAIQTGQERLTLELLEHVANTRLKLLKPAIAALRDVDPRSLLRFEDLLPTDVQIESMMTPAPSATAANRHLQVLRTLRSRYMSMRQANAGHRWIP